jgi:hypothetical protein
VLVSSVFKIVSRLVSLSEFHTQLAQVIFSIENVLSDFSREIRIVSR